MKRLAAVFLYLVFHCACARHYGLYHEVKPGENFFRIAKAYDQNPQELAEINDLEDPTKLQIGDRVFIPGVEKPRRVEVMRSPNEVATARSRQAGRKAESPMVREKSHPPEDDNQKIETFRGDFVWPLRGKVSSHFGARGKNYHDGIDISAAQGTLIRAAAAGKVIYADRRISGYGNMVIVKHKGVFSTVYAHNQINYVKKNDFVERGEVLGRVGQTGRASGPHLHFEVRKGRKAVNPLFYLPKTQ